MTRLPYPDRCQLRALLHVRQPADVRAYFQRGVKCQHLLDAAAGADVDDAVAARILAKLPAVVERLLGPPPQPWSRPAPASPWPGVLPGKLETAYVRLVVDGRLAALCSDFTDDKRPRLRLVTSPAEVL